MEESLGSRLSSQEAIAARNKEEAMPPSSVYIDRTTEKRFKGSGAVYFLVMAVVLVLAGGLSWPPPREDTLLAPPSPKGCGRSICLSYLSA